MASYEIDQSSSREVSWRDSKDIQGIPWNSKEISISRKEMRTHRISQSTFRNSTIPLSFIKSPTPVLSDFYSFHHNFSALRCRYGHFQVRDNVHMQDSIFFLNENYAIEEFCLESEESRIRQISERFEILTFNVKEHYLSMGGYEGNLRVKNLRTGESINMIPNVRSEYLYCSKFIYESDKLYLLAYSNDEKARIIDLEDPANSRVFDFSYAVNNAAMKGNIIAGAMDALEVELVDIRSNSKVRKLHGHNDFTFSVDWDPRYDWYLATASQDHCVKIWDVRKDEAVHTLCGAAGAIYKVEYSKCGNFLAFIESIDFLHIYDTREFESGQLIDLFGRTTGFCFSQEENPQSVFLGVNESDFDSLMEFRRSESIGYINL